MSLKCDVGSGRLELDQHELAMNLSDHAIEEVRAKFPPTMQLRAKFCEPKLDHFVTVHMPRLSFLDDDSSGGGDLYVNQTLMC